MQTIKDATFRIVIYDLINKKSKTVSLTNHKEMNLDDIKKMIISCLEKGTTKQ